MRIRFEIASVTAHLLSNRYLCRVGKKPVAPVAQRQSGINDDLAVLDLHHTGETAYAQRLRSKNLNMHIMPRQSRTRYFLG